MMKNRENQINIKIIERLLSLFVISFLTFINVQLCIQQAGSLFWEKNTEIKESFSANVSASENTSSHYHYQKSGKVSLASLIGSGSNHFVTTSDSSEKTVIFPEEQLEIEIYENAGPFSATYCIEKYRSFYISVHPSVRTSKSFRTRPPPFY